jgi:hypothetical protein
MSGPGVQRSLAAVHGGAKRRGSGKKLDKIKISNNQQKIPYSRLVRANRQVAPHHVPLSL